MPRKTKTTCYWIYMLECDNGSYYTGYTVNLARRFRQHFEGKAGVRYTRSHPPVRIAQCWRLFDTIGTALKVELMIKKKPRRTKERLVADPSVLATLAASALERKVRIYKADPAQIQAESMELSARQLKDGFDPFAGLPQEDMTGGLRSSS